MSNPGTVMPTPYQTVFDTNGDPISGALIWTYVAGLSTPLATYTTAALSVANTNPIVADSAGRFVAFIAPGTSYKFVFETAATPPAHGTVIRTVDLVASVPGVSNNVDITGVAGEALTAGQVVYLSDGSGSKVAGLWYIASSANAYSSSAAITVGIVPAAIASSASGTIRLAGSVTGLSLSTGSTYYVGVAGVLTSTPPANVRLLGIADSTSSIVLSANPGLPLADNGVNNFRLTLTTGVPVTTADVTAATTLYASPFHGTRLSLFDSAGNATLYTSAQFSIAVPATTNTTYDVFCYASSGTPTLELLAWRNSGQIITGATNATPIVITANSHGLSNGDEVYVSGVVGNTAANGTWTVANITANTFELATSVGNGGYTASTGYLNARASTGKLVLTTTGSYTKTGDLTRRYLGTCRTTGSSGQTEDSKLKRYVWNYYNRVDRQLYVAEATDTWTYSTATWRQANAAAGNQVDVVVGVPENILRLIVRHYASNSGAGGGVVVQTGIGRDSTTFIVAGVLGIGDLASATLLNQGKIIASLEEYPPAGRHFYTWMERSTAVGTTTWYGDGGDATLLQTGLSGWIQG